MKTYKISIISIITVALYVVIFKIYFIPEILRQFLRVLIIVGTFFFLVSRLTLKKLINISIVFACSIILSGIINYFQGAYTAKALLDSVAYALNFYVLYTFSEYCHYAGQFQRYLRCLYYITVTYCILTLISVGIVGVENNSNVSAYLFGNKFTSSYLCLLLIGLYGATHNMRRRMNKIVLWCLIAYSLGFTFYVECTTATIATIVVGIIYFLPSIKVILLNPKCVCVCLISSALILPFIGGLLQIPFVNNIVYGFFDKSITIAGRLQIYSQYLGKIILAKPIWGWGYSNGAMYALTDGIFGNAQNGLMEQFVNYGLIGIVIIVFTTYYCFKIKDKKENTLYISLIVYAMIVSAVVEVTINWFFFIGLCLIRWNVIRKETSYEKSSIN